MTTTILLFEAQRIERQLLMDLLIGESYRIHEASCLKRALEILNQSAPEGIILGINDDNEDTLQSIQTLRAATHIPIIILSWRFGKSFEIDCFRAGADEFIEKLSEGDIMLARIHRHIERYKILKQAFPIREHRQNVTFGTWELNYDLRQIFDLSGRKGTLSQKEVLLLEYLIENKNRAISRQELCRVLSPNGVMSHRALDVKISRLRDKLNDKNTKNPFIQTVHGIGYVFSDQL